MTDASGHGSGDRGAGVHTGYVSRVRVVRS